MTSRISRGGGGAEWAGITPVTAGWRPVIGGVARDDVKAHVLAWNHTWNQADTGTLIISTCSFEYFQYK